MATAKKRAGKKASGKKAVVKKAVAKKTAVKKAAAKNVATKKAAVKPVVVEQAPVQEAVSVTRPTGGEARSMERNEAMQVKAHAEDMKAQNVKAARTELQRKQLPPNKR